MTADSKRDESLWKSPLFQGMESELLQGLVASARFVEHTKGAVFLEQHRPVTRFYFIVNGWCGAVKTNSEGQESILQLFRHGNCLPAPGGAEPLLTSPVSLQALTPVRLAMLSPTIVHNALERSRIFSANMLAASVQSCNDLRNHVEQLTLHTAEERIGRFLLDMRLASHEKDKAITLPFDKNLTAAYLGIKPETLSRALRNFKDNGFVIERSHLHMPHRRALCHYCDATSAQQCPTGHSEECPHYEENKAARS
jgi:CRP-like cAMP-binding protein